MRTARFGLLFVCVLFSVDAAYKTQKTYDSHRDVREQGEEQVFKSVLDSFDVHPAKKPEYITAFRHGHGHTNQRGTSEFECPQECTMDLRPVCGSDGHTYPNKCALMVNACKQKKRIYVEKEGGC